MLSQYFCFRRLCLSQMLGRGYSTVLMARDAVGAAWEVLILSAQIADCWCQIQVSVLKSGGDWTWTASLEQVWCRCAGLINSAVQHVTPCFLVVLFSVTVLICLFADETSDYKAGDKAARGSRDDAVQRGASEGAARLPAAASVAVRLGRLRHLLRLHRQVRVQGRVQGCEHLQDLRDSGSLPL